ncbi:hypothetical protein [Alishewanella sp. HL-SH05]|uniref:hypothetical protein n=1 Tax=Alishewanella sp. HL-SH05 TaxID=3461145 RepID=UPI0040424F81
MFRYCSRFVFLAAAPKVNIRQFVGLLQTVVAVALFFLASLKQFLQVPVGSPYRSWPVSFLIQAAVPLFGFASAASRESPVQAANKQSQPTRTAQLL